MAKFTWQDGTLVSKAKVEIDGTIYEVDPEEYSGATPLSASNLNTMQDGIYNDIGDVSELETTAKESLVDATNELNATRLIKLWENSNPNASFASQTITLNSNDYDYLIWFYGFYRGNLFQKSTTVLKTQKISLDISRDYGVGGTYYSGNFWRNAETSDYLSFQISNCYVKYGNNTGSTTDNNYVIPIAVYGGKF